MFNRVDAKKMSGIDNIAIDTEFELKSWEKSLKELSPWEKWTLLLIFYLMIDEEWIIL